MVHWICSVHIRCQEADLNEGTKGKARVSLTGERVDIVRRRSEERAVVGVLTIHTDTPSQPSFGSPNLMLPDLSWRAFLPYTCSPPPWPFKGSLGSIGAVGRPFGLEVPAHLPPVPRSFLHPTLTLSSPPYSSSSRARRSLDGRSLSFV